MITSAKHPLNHYKWGADCDGWDLAQDDHAAVKEELMPPGSAEKLHFHQHATQFFYILKGQACFKIEEEIIVVNPFEGLKIEPGKKHKIMNNTNSDLGFILFSCPPTKNDRIDCE